MLTLPALSPPPLGFGPQASPQSPMLHPAVSALADHCPVNDGGASAFAQAAAKRPPSTTFSIRLPDRM
jgi:hypothetical protein